MINRNSKHGNFLYKQSQILKLISARENIGRIFYKSKYSKRFTRWLEIASRAGLVNEVEDAQRLMTAINQNQYF